MEIASAVEEATVPGAAGVAITVAAAAVEEEEEGDAAEEAAEEGAEVAVVAPSIPP